MEGLVADTSTDPVPDGMTYNGGRVGIRLEVYSLRLEADAPPAE